MTVKIQVRRGTAANWTSVNPTLSSGEIGFETDTKKIKVGDGSTAWTALSYAAGGNEFDTSIIFEGATANAYETTLTVVDPTADRTITLPDVTGTVVTTGNLSSITSVGSLSSLTVTGDLTVNGTTTTINSTTLSVDDKNIELGSVDTPSNTTADGGGLTLKGATDKTFNWVNSTTSWTSSENLDLATGKTLKIAGTDVLSGSTLGSGITGSSLTSVGTIATGTWQGTAVGLAYGGTGKTTAPAAMANLMGYTSTATAAGTTTLTNTSSYYQVFTGVTTQTIVLPVTSTLQTGWSFHLVNNSTGLVTINSSGGNQVIIIPANTTAMVTCIGTTLTTAADWEFGVTDFSTYTGSGNVVMATSPTISGLTLTGSLTANSSTGTSGFVLTSTGSGVQWAAAAADSTPTVFMLMGG